MGHVKRFFTCVTIDPTDSYAYCGTRTGDFVEVLIDKATYKRSGPVNRVFVGGIQQLLSSPMKDIIVCAGDGTLAKISKKTLQLQEETRLQGAVKSMVTNDQDRLIVTSSKSILYSVDL